MRSRLLWLFGALLASAALAALPPLGEADPGRKVACYVATAEDVFDGRILANARRTGWALPSIYHGRVVGELQFVDDGGVPGLLVQGAYDGTYWNESDAALQAVLGTAAPSASSLEVRRLEIPALSFIAVWLRGPKGDVLIPIDPTYGRCKANHPYSERQVVAFLRASARDAVEHPFLIR